MGSKRHGKPQRVVQLPASFSSSLVHVKSRTDDNHEDNPFTLKNRNDAANNLSPVPVTRNVVFGQLKGPDAIPRAAIFYALQSDKITKWETWHPFVIFSGPKKRVTVWWHGKQAVLLRETYLPVHTIERSIIYAGVETARRRHDKGCVTWSSPVPFRACPVVSPDPTV